MSRLSFEIPQNIHPINLIIYQHVASFSSRSKLHTRAFPIKILPLFFVEISKEKSLCQWTSVCLLTRRFVADKNTRSVTLERPRRREDVDFPTMEKNRRAGDEPDETTKPRRDTRVVVSSGNTPADLNYSMNVPVHSLCRARDARCFPFPRGEQSRARKARLCAAFYPVKERQSSSLLLRNRLHQSLRSLPLT